MTSLPPDLPTALVTGASSGIGAVYADRFARRGHPVILVARDRERLDGVAAQLGSRYCVDAEVLRADLTDPADLALVERRLADDASIGVLVNDAGMSSPGEFAAIDPEAVDRLIALNVAAPTRLTAALVPRLVDADPGEARGSLRAIVTVGSMVSLMPDYGARVFGDPTQNQAVYGATKAYLLYFSQSLHSELAPHGVYTQAVVPAATRTRVFERTGRDVVDIPGMMEAEDFVDAAMVGFDRREAVTMPSLFDDARWRDLDRARVRLVSDIAHSQPAARYVTTHAGQQSPTTASVLSVGLDPAMFEGADTDAGALDHDAIVSAAKTEYARLREAGMSIERCLVLPDASAEATYRSALRVRFDYIVIGAGIRLDPDLSQLFEMLVNVTVELCPEAQLVFDTGPDTKADAVLRRHRAVDGD